jgi:prefoldin subunit 5
MFNPRFRTVPLLLVPSLLLVAGCEREPPPELSEEVESLRMERERLQSELDEVTATVEAIRDELREVELPEEVRDDPPTTARDTVRAILRGSAERVADARAELQRVRGQAATMQRRADSLRTALDEVVSEQEALLAEERERMAELEERAHDLTARRESLEAEVERLSAAVEEWEAEANRVYYVAGTPDELRRRGVVEREGGARVLLVLWKRGEALVPARGLDPAEFTAIDLRETREIPLPNPEARYRLVSRQSLEYIDAEDRASERVRGARIHITDPERFWESSRFLILVEED